MATGTSPAASTAAPASGPWSCTSVRGGTTSRRTVTRVTVTATVVVTGTTGTSTTTTDRPTTHRRCQRPPSEPRSSPSRQAAVPFRGPRRRTEGIVIVSLVTFFYSALLLAQSLIFRSALTLRTTARFLTPRRVASRLQPGGTHRPVAAARVPSRP